MPSYIHAMLSGQGNSLLGQSEPINWLKVEIKKYVKDIYPGAVQDEHFWGVVPSRTFFGGRRQLARISTRIRYDRRIPQIKSHKSGCLTKIWGPVPPSPAYDPLYISVYNVGH